MSAESHDKAHSYSGSPRFATTRWSLILEAARRDTPQAQDAIAKLCESYWYPLYAYVRRTGYNADDAQDATQAFFVHLLEKFDLNGVDRDKGRFRSYLLGALKHFLEDDRDQKRALKRGGGRTIVSLEFKDAEDRYAFDPAKGLTAEQIFERRWALLVLERVLARLQREYVASGKGTIFERLKEFLAGQNRTDSFSSAAIDLKMTEGAAKVAAHRLRRRYAQLLEHEIMETVAAPSDIQDEIQHLFKALG